MDFTAKLMPEAELTLFMVYGEYHYFAGQA